MSDLAVRAEKLSKRYWIGSGSVGAFRYNALRDVLTEAMYAPVRWVRRMGEGRRGTGDTVSSRDGYIWALKDISFEVKEGEVLGIIGRNGAGKTTLLKILSRVTEPTGGYAEIRDRVGSLLEVGTGFHPELTGRENIYLNGAILGMKRAEIQRKFDEILAFAEIEKFIDTPVKRYSSGMYMRLAFSVAAHLEPEILLVDEVLAVGDAAFQKKCLGKMGDVAKEGRTVLFVSHNMAAVRGLCRSAMLLDGGENVFSGPVDAVIDHYLQAPVAEGQSGRLAPDMHRVNTGELWIDQVSVTNGSGEPAGQLRMAEPLTVTILFEVRQPAQQIRMGVGFNTPEGVRIATLHHTDGGQEPFDADPGIYRVSLTLTNPLLPGAYIISVGAHRALGGGTVDYVPEALRFHVLEISAGDDTHEAHNQGLVRFGASWSPPHRAERL